MKKNEIYLEPSSYYHVYNRAVGKDKLFYSEANYLYFLRKYQEYISPIAETFVYCLMPNHFHFLILVKTESEIQKILAIENKLITKNRQTNLYVSKQFSNLFNGYSQAINKQQSRHGSLFSRPFKRKQIDSIEYLRNVALYIHSNPVNHGYMQHAKEWKFSSYNSIISDSNLELKRDVVISWFEDLDNFTKIHESYNVNKLIELELE